jgi:long-subunit fatty acid transport protein
MRRNTLLATLVASLLTLPAAAQNTDIESLSGQQFNFGNPGARSLGMGGAFIGLADDASAAEANPAGLTILRKPELSIEGRNYLEEQVLTTSGTFPDLTRTAFNHYSNRVEVTFGSVVYPIKNFTLAAYYHSPLHNVGAGEVIPVRNEFSGRVEQDVPTFHLPRNGSAPVSAAQCAEIRRAANNDPFACRQFVVNPFLTAVDVEQRTYGIGGAWQVHPKFSVGATARYQTFREAAFTYRLTPQFAFQSISVQATGQARESDGELELEEESDVTFTAGVKWNPTDRISVGAVYKMGPSFVAPTFIANANTGFDYVNLADTVFHVPDVAGLGVSIRPIPVLTVNLDVVHVAYSNLTDDFVSTIREVREDIEDPFQIEDGVEWHLGAEYFFSTRIPFALRAGYWRDPAHSIEWRGGLGTAESVGAAILYPEGEAQNHWSIGGGLAWPRFQIDLAYDNSEHFKVGSISVVTRF